LTRNRGPKRQVTWFGPADQGHVAVATTTKVIIASIDPAASGLEKPTIVRTRGMIGVRPDSGVAADTAFVGAFGIGIVSDQAFAAGVASVPGPFDQGDWDGWFVWQSFQATWDFNSAVGVEPLEVEYEIDSKAMRKVSDNETVVFVAESQAGAFDISVPLRMLFKLS